MTGKLTLDTPLEDCTVNEQKTITLTVTPTSNDKNGFTAKVESVEGYEEDEPDEPSTGKQAPAVKKVMGKYGKMGGGKMDMGEM